MNYDEENYCQGRVNYSFPSFLFRHFTILLFHTYSFHNIRLYANNSFTCERKSVSIHAKKNADVSVL